MDNLEKLATYFNFYWYLYNWSKQK